MNLNEYLEIAFKIAALFHFVTTWNSFRQVDERLALKDREIALLRKMVDEIIKAMKPKIIEDIRSVQRTEMETEVLKRAVREILDEAAE